ncbi:MAG: spermidine synthase [Burkholderiaceae bacterium]
MLLYPVTIFLSAFLLFLVQPLIGKQVLPWFGGSAGVWTVCLVFFQVFLLAGYAYADALSRLHMRVQAAVHTAVLAASVFTLPIIANPALRPVHQAGGEEPAWQVLKLLVLTIGMPYFLVATTGPLLQSWFSKAYAYDLARQQRVYRLFALSNFASLSALIAYPFVVEPFISVRQQAMAWSAAFIAFAALAAVTGWVTAQRCARLPPAADAQAAAPTYLPPQLREYVLWLALPALGTALLLAVTTHITQNVASVPFLWILPLSLYLLSFILCFEGERWYPRVLVYPLLMVMIPAMAWALSASNAVLAINIAIPLFAVGLFVLCMFLHGELAAAKPAPRYLTRFYLCISAGGALGGLAVGLLAPELFSGYWELPLALMACAVVLWLLHLSGGSLGHSLLTAGFTAAAMFGIHQAVPQATPLVHWGAYALAVVVLLLIVSSLTRTTRTVTASAAAAVLVLAGYASWQYYALIVKDSVAMQRNFFGVVRVDGDASSEIRRLKHGVITHGSQFISQERRREPTTYYGAASGAGLAMTHLRPGPLRVGLIGMGVGTMAAHGQQGDVLRFYEINPQVITLANEKFTFLRDSKAKIETILGDARLMLEAEPPQNYDVLIVDAFTSDAIPAHLLTREALAVYLRHMKPSGAVLFHISNRYLDLAPVVQMLAENAGFSAQLLVDDPKEYWLSRTSYVMVTRNQALLSNTEIAAYVEPIKARPGLPLWTDDYNNLFKILK